MYSTEDHRHSSEVKIKTKRSSTQKACTIAKQNSLVDVCDLRMITEKDVEAMALKTQILEGK
jgi:hypothetical protein